MHTIQAEGSKETVVPPPKEGKTKETPAPEKVAKPGPKTKSVQNLVKKAKESGAWRNDTEKIAQAIISLGEDESPAYLEAIQYSSMGKGTATENMQSFKVDKKKDYLETDQALKDRYDAVLKAAGMKVPAEGTASKQEGPKKPALVF